MATAMTTKIRQSPTSLDRINDYAERVLSGDIVAGPHVRNACRRHFDDLATGSERGIWFDVETAGQKLGFFEDVLRLSEG